VSRSQRRKGIDGEREVARLMEGYGYTLRGLESGGDWIAVGGSLPLAVEVKRQEVLRIPLWQRQALADRVPGTLPLVAFRASRSAWWGMSPLEEMLGALKADAPDLGR
jgi:Holliday junction resolvase